MPPNTLSPAKDLRIAAAQLYVGSSNAPLQDVVIEVQQGRIAAITRRQGDVDLHVAIAAPGFIDLQINGANDVQFNDQTDAAAVVEIAHGARQGGSAHILPTFITDEGIRYQQAVTAVAEARAAGTPGIAGVHLEGPFLSPNRPGIHPPHCIRPLGAEDMQFLQASAADGTCGTLLLTLAPECTAAGQIRRLSDAGVTVFAGHSAASHAEMQSAIREGLRGATHLWNAMSPLTSREPGVVGAVLAARQLYAGIIADGVHVDFANVGIAARLMPDHLCLVTDAMLTLEGTTTQFQIHGVEIHRDGNRLSDAKGTLAGAHLAMDEALRNMVQQVGIPLPDALRMASGNPARAIGRPDLAQIRQGAAASLTFLTQDLGAIGTLADGQLHLTQDTPHVAA